MEYITALLCVAQNNRERGMTLLELILPVNLFTVAVF